MAEFNLKVYNRWGEKVWESSDPLAEWDGTYKGEIVASGSHNWTIRAKDAYSGNYRIWRGNVLIIK